MQYTQELQHSQDFAHLSHLPTVAPLFAIAVNRRVVGKVKPGSPAFRELNMTFREETLDAAGLLSAIRQGHAWTARHRQVQHEQGGGRLSTYRVKQNVIDVAVLALDIDTEDERARLDTLAAEPFIRQYAAIIHTTASHKPDAPRARVVFILSEPVGVATAETGLLALLNERFPYADRNARDASRLFYGAKGCESVMLGSVLPVDVLQSEIDAYEWRQLARQEERELERQTRQTKTTEANAGQVARYIWTTKQRVLDAVAGASQGSRHNTLRGASVRLGSLSAATWIDDAARGILAGAEDDLTTAASVWANGDEREVARIVRDGLDYGSSRPAWEPDWSERTARATPREPETPAGESLERELERQARIESIRLAREFFRDTYPGGDVALAYEDKQIKKLGNPLQFMTTLKTHVDSGEWVFIHTRAKARRDSVAQLKKDAWRLAKQIEEEQRDGRVFYLATLPSEADWRRARDAWQKRKQRAGGAIAWQVYRQEDKTVVVIHDDVQRGGELIPTELDRLIDLTRRLLLGMPVPEDETRRVRTSQGFGGNYTGSRGDGRQKRAERDEWEVVAQLKTEGAPGLNGAAAALGIELSATRRGKRQMSHEDAILALAEAGFTMTPRGHSASVEDILSGGAGQMSDIASIEEEGLIDTISDILTETPDATPHKAFASATLTDGEPAEGDILDWFLATGGHRTARTVAL